MSLSIFPIKVTLLVPIRNESHHILTSLNSILGQDYPDRYLEVIIIDGDSIDGSYEIVNKFIASVNKFSWYLINNPERIVPKSLNKAINISTGDIIIRIDGHSGIQPNYISNCVENLINFEVDAVGGYIDTIGTSFIGNVIAIAMSSKFGVGGSEFRTSKSYTKETDSIPFPAYTRDVFIKNGLYDEEMLCNEDDEFNFRLRKKGAKLLLVDGIRTKYFCRSNFHALWVQYYRYGLWKVRILQKHPHQMSLRQFVPPAFVASLGLTLVLALFMPVFSFVFASILGAYFLVNLLASILTATKKGWQHLLLLPVVFAILHFSYGLGFLVGLVKFANRWNDKIGNVPPGKPFQP